MSDWVLMTELLHLQDLTWVLSGACRAVKCQWNRTRSLPLLSLEITKLTYLRGRSFKCSSDTAPRSRRRTCRSATAMAPALVLLMNTIRSTSKRRIADGGTSRTRTFDSQGLGQLRAPHGAKGVKLLVVNGISGGRLQGPPRIW